MSLIFRGADLFVNPNGTEEALFENLLNIKNLNGKAIGSEQAYSYIPDYSNPNVFPGFLTVGVEGFEATITGARLVNSAPVATPEPGTMLLMGVGVLGAVLMRRRSQKNS